ncbi:MAG TPA: hypothetical protein VN709_08805 [Terriglobales bacterium]|nr:hypothetical protein [Terriglobales bacterium]
MQVTFEDRARPEAAFDHPVGSPDVPLTAAQLQSKVASLVGAAESARLQSLVAGLRNAPNLAQLLLAPGKQQAGA